MTHTSFHHKNNKALTQHSTYKHYRKFLFLEKRKSYQLSFCRKLQKMLAAPCVHAYNQLTVSKFLSTATLTLLLSTPIFSKTLHHLFFNLIDASYLLLGEEGGVFFVILLADVEQFFAHFKAVF